MLARCRKILKSTWGSLAREVLVFRAKRTISISITLLTWGIFWLFIFTIKTWAFVQTLTSIIIWRRTRRRWMSCKQYPLEFLGDSNVKDRGIMGILHNCTWFCHNRCDRHLNQGRFGSRRGVLIIPSLNENWGEGCSLIPNPIFIMIWWLWLWSEFCKQCKKDLYQTHGLAW